MADIHNAGNNTDPARAAIVRASDRDAWLAGTPDDARAVLKPYPSEMMVAYEVSSRVNSVKNDSPELIRPVDGVELSGVTRDLFVRLARCKPRWRNHLYVPNVSHRIWTEDRLLECGCVHWSMTIAAVMSAP